MVAMGRLQLSISDLFHLTLDDLWLMMEGKDYEEKQAWERARWQAALLLAPHAKKGQTIAPENLGKFPWEKSEQVKRIKRKTMTPQEVERLNRTLANLKK